MGGRPERRRGVIGRLRQRVEAFLVKRVWDADLDGFSFLRRTAYRVARIGYLAVRGFRDHRCSTHASGLTYVTVLSIVPLLAMAFSVAKGLGAYERLRAEVVNPFLDRTFGANGVEGAASDLRSAIDKVFHFVERTDFGSLGAIGLLVLLWTGVKLLSAVEHTLNDIWGVRRSRTFARKFADYLSLVVVVPVLLMAATTVTTALHADYLPEGLSELWPKFVAIGATVIGFTLIYRFTPNVKVRFSSALLGGLLAGGLWHLAQLAHVAFQVGVARYNAIYSTFAALPVFLVWLFVSWTILLMGAELASAHTTEPVFRRSFKALALGPAARRIVALKVVLQVAGAFRDGDAPLAPGLIAEQIKMPERLVNEVTSGLESAGILSVVEDGQDNGGALVLARDPAAVHLLDVVEAVDGLPLDSEDQGLGSVAAVLQELRLAQVNSPENIDIESLLARGLEPED
ncbi:MAG: YhjD/YihY/BrkB family envelope integrity protein [bacterium]